MPPLPLTSEALHSALRTAILVLPPQRALAGYVTLNPLRALETQPFDQALRQLSNLEARPALRPESFYQEAWRRARILESDLDAVIAHHLTLQDRPANSASPPSWPLQPSNGSLADFLKTLLTHPIPIDDSLALEWRISETNILDHFPENIPRRSVEAFLAEGTCSQQLRKLWQTCLQLQRQNQNTPTQLKATFTIAEAAELRLAKPLRPELHNILIRWFASWLDISLSSWPQPKRDAGLFKSFTMAMDELGPLAPFPSLHRLARQTILRADSAEACLLSTLNDLALDETTLTDFLRASLLDLKGWFGQIAAREARPDFAPDHAAPASLIDGLALRVLIERALIQEHGPIELSSLSLTRPPPGPTEQQLLAAAWELFHFSLLLGLTPSRLDSLSPEDRSELFSLPQRYNSFERRWLWHLAYERRLKVELFDSVLAHTPTPPHGPNSWQLATCIDDREESFRRHCEELDPALQTFGVAGFFYLPLCLEQDGRKNFLCPVNARPTISLRPKNPRGPSHNPQLSRLRSALITLFAWGPLFPQIVDTIWPPKPTPEAQDELELGLVNAPTDGGDEAQALEKILLEGLLRTLSEMGLTRNFAPIVVLLGHGGESQNNPHAATYHCGACGGGRGGPNARVFARSINQPAIRKQLAALGLQIPDTTWFIGGFHNTTTDLVTLYDLSELPTALQPQLEKIQATIREASARNALERCRRFVSAPLNLNPEQAFAHVADRAIDLAQPRPEYGHASHAFALVGHRNWSRGLFLDRRSFLISFDPREAEAKETLRRTLASVAPIGAGINLDYFFSFTDRERFGSGTKLPHNVTAGIGVMNGANSDLRTGLPWQGVELHEPARLLLLIEASPEDLAEILRLEPGLATLVLNRWVLVASFDSINRKIFDFTERGFEPYIPSRTEALTASDSLTLTRFKRESIRPHSLRGQA